MTETYPKTTIKITTKTEYEREMKRITKLFSQKETEETWDQFKRALDNLSQWITQENISSWTTFPTHLKQLKLPIIRCLESPRTLLSASASGLLKSTAQTMKTDFSKLNPLFVEAIIKQFGSTNKIHSARIQSDYKEVIEHAKLPKCISLFSEYLINKIKHKNNSHLRFCLADCLVVLIRVNPETVLKRLSQDIERAIRVASTDACASVRSAIRQVYKAYDEKMPELASLFYAHLTRAEQKHLEPQVHPVTLRRSSSFSSSSTLHTTPILPQKSSSTLSSHKRHQKTPSTLSSQSIHTPNIKTTVNNHPQSKHTLSKESQKITSSLMETEALLSSSSSSTSTSSSFSLPSPSLSLPLSVGQKRPHQDDNHTIKPVKKHRALPPISTTMRHKKILNKKKSRGS